MFGYGQKRSRGLRLLLLGALVCGLTSMAPAALIDYSTTGVFSLGVGSGSTLSTAASTNDTISNSGIHIRYDAAGATGLFIPDGGTGNIGLGTFHVSADPGTPTATFSDSFTLSVTQSIPLPGGTEQFGQASVSGTIFWNGSQAVVQFTSPLSVTINSAPPVIYTIASADNNVAGRLLLNGPTTNTGAGLGNTSIQGQATVVPLPAAAWAGMALMGVISGRKLRLSRRPQA